METITQAAHVALENAMKAHVNHNVSMMNNWHRLVVAENATMSVEAVSALASSNLRSTAATAVLNELEYSFSADRIASTLVDHIQHELNSNGPKEFLAVYVEAQRILSDTDSHSA